MTNTHTTAVAVPPILQPLVAQDRAVAVMKGSIANPFHAYLFVGPRGTGKRDAALRMAAAVICPNGGCGVCPSCRDVLSELHPDVVVVERVGASISVGQAEEIISLSQRSPAVARFQIIVLVDFHLVGDAAPALLKTIEEPPNSTIFLVLADSLPRSLVTIASRCVEVEFVALESSAIEAILMSEGVPEAIAAASAAVARGALDRARLFAADPGFGTRQARWRTVPDRLDGTGAVVAQLAVELLSGADELVGVLQARQAEELEAVKAASERAGEKHVPGLKAITDRHRREQRRVRTDELRAGFASMAEAFRARLGAPNIPPRRLASLTKSCAAVDAAASQLVRNPNELLLVQNLLLNLDSAD